MITTKLLVFLMALEGFNSCAYSDVSQFSNGFGTKARHKFECINLLEAKQRMISHVKEDSEFVLSIFPDANEHEHDALVSYCYNAGRAGCSKAVHLAAAGKKEAAAWVMKNKVNKGLPSEAGLRKRREKEIALLVEPLKPKTFVEWLGSGYHA